MSKLIIKRDSEWINAMRDVGIYLDGKKIGVISNGETKQFEIETGKHQLSTRIDWCGSKPVAINLSEVDIQKVKLSSFKFGRWLMPLFLLGFLLVGFKQYISRDLILVLFIIMIPLGVYVLYYLTFGHNSYLRLRKI